MDKRELWQIIYQEAQNYAKQEPLLTSFLYNTILNHCCLEKAISYHLANKLADANLQPTALMELFTNIFQQDPTVIEFVCDDIIAVKERDPACIGYVIPLLFFKGFQALESYRMSHYLWCQGKKILALTLQSRISEVFGVDIHPAAKIGRGVMIDHATGLVVGETAVIGNNVSILHGVTLGGTGKERGDRHPKVGNGVLIGADAQLLGNIRIGDGAKVGAGSVVLEDVPPHTTVVGIPARVVGTPRSETPALEMDQRIE